MGADIKKIYSMDNGYPILEIKDGLIYLDGKPFPTVLEYCFDGGAKKVPILTMKMAVNSKINPQEEMNNMDKNIEERIRELEEKVTVLENNQEQPPKKFVDKIANSIAYQILNTLKTI